jgi:hypothetical protein
MENIKPPTKTNIGGCGIFNYYSFLINENFKKTENKKIKQTNFQVCFQLQLICAKQIKLQESIRACLHCCCKDLNPK